MAEEEVVEVAEAEEEAEEEAVAEAAEEEEAVHLADNPPLHQEHLTTEED